MQLTSTTNFNLEQFNLLSLRKITPDEYIHSTERYAKLMKQRLSDHYEINGVLAHPLNRFIPCDEEGNVLEEPMEWDFVTGEEAHEFGLLCEQYQVAKDRMLFETDYDIDDIEFIISYYDTVEDMEIGTSRIIKLTPATQKLIK